MADVFTETKRSEVMSLIRSRGNRDTEFRMISMFREHRITGWRRGAPLPGRPDFIFRGEKVAVFVDGRVPSSRREYWQPKLARNVQRDRAVARALRAAGWKVFRVWECALTRQRSGRTAARIAGALARARAAM